MLPLSGSIDSLPFRLTSVQIQGKLLSVPTTQQVLSGSTRLSNLFHNEAQLCPMLQAFRRQAKFYSKQLYICCWAIYLATFCPLLPAFVVSLIVWILLMFWLYDALDYFFEGTWCLKPNRSLNFWLINAVFPPPKLGYEIMPYILLPSLPHNLQPCRLSWQQTHANMCPAHMFLFSCLSSFHLVCLIGSW